MSVARRQFLTSAALGGVSLSALGKFGRACAAEPGVQSLSDERMAAAEGSFYRAYRSKPSPSADVLTWAQIDLGSTRLFDAIKLYPSKTHTISGEGFPVRFRVECSDDADFVARRLLADHTKGDYPDPEDHVVQIKAGRAKARYVRITATRLPPNKVPSHFLSFGKESVDRMKAAASGTHVFALAKIEVLARSTDLALHRPVAVDAAHGNPADAPQLTRARRPQGEGILTDHPKNVTLLNQWRAAAYQVQSPRGGVRLQEGLFATALQNTIDYLLESYTVDDLLRLFRARAGKPLPVSTQPPNPFWDDLLAGSNAGRFLMGAGNALQWVEHAQLRRRLNAVVDGIAQCRQNNGYLMAYPEDTFFVSERGAYARAWLTHGMLDAGDAGHPKAFELLRGYYDWYNSRPYLKEMLRGAIQGGQGMVANTRVYFSPVGKPADIHVLQRYFQENYWLEDLAARKVDAVWQYPYDRPHSYLITNLEGYLDLYRATGERRYLDAVLGGWELYRENWQSIGGSFFIIELEKNEPKSYPLYDALGETCASAFWILLNHRLHQLDPSQERYVAEIEKSIYNVLLANHCGARGIRYHTMLVGQKEEPRRINTCCEGQASRVLASLSKFIYSIAEDGLYINLFEPSSIEWTQGSERLRVEMVTSFPRDRQVRIKVQPSKPMQAKIRIRAPSWAAGVMRVEVNGEPAASGQPGGYVTLDRLWAPNDEISFVLPMAFKLTQYVGVDRIPGRERYCLEYGPLLMAALGKPATTELVLHGALSPMDIIRRLEPVKDKPLRFAVSGVFGPGEEFAPYFELNAEVFTCAPFIESKPAMV